MKQEKIGWQCHQLHHCKSFALCSRQITMPAPHHSFFTGRMLFLTLNQQCQITEGNYVAWQIVAKICLQTVSDIARLLDNSRIRQLADCQLTDWTSRGLVNSRTRQLMYWTTCGCHQQLCVLSFRSFGGICETASCPARELAIRELAYLQVVQLPTALPTLSDS